AGGRDPPPAGGRGGRGAGRARFDPTPPGRKGRRGALAFLAVLSGEVASHAVQGVVQESLGGVREPNPTVQTGRGPLDRHGHRLVEDPLPAPVAGAVVVVDRAAMDVGPP